jgi:3-oxoacyl-[acyl-carrier-protein] synthase III
MALGVSGVAIRGLACALPAQVVTNDAFIERFGAEGVKSVVDMIGVETRHVAAPHQTTADLCEAAARVVLERLSWAPETVDALIFVSQTPDYRLPATACALHGKLALPTTCQAFDVNLGCSGYVYGLWLAHALIAAGVRRVLLLAGDTISKTVDPADRGTALVFGDAGSATALEAEVSAPAAYFVLGTDGSGAQSLIIPQGGYRPAQDAAADDGPAPDRLHMNGGEVFAFTLKAVPALIRDTLAVAGRGIDDVDAVLLHQANRFMLRHLVKKIGADPDRVPINIDRYGNTSSATIPLLLTTDLATRVTGGPSRMLMAGFGVGLSWAGALIELPQLVCAETVIA